MSPKEGSGNALAASSCVPTITEPPDVVSQGVGFLDINKSPYRTAILSRAGAGVVTGYIHRDGREFHPDDPVKIFRFVKMILGR